MTSIAVYFLPQEIPAGALRGSFAIAVDVLRASTTIVTSLANGASGVYPCQTVEEAHSTASQLGNPLLGGERHGKPIPGFQLGNSPLEYTSERVEQKRIVFTTTNGTRAILACQGANRVSIASFVNRLAICKETAGFPRVALICAGTGGEPTGEDMMFAGSVCELLCSQREMTLDLKARVSREIWRMAQRRMDQGATLDDLLRESQGGRNLIELGYQDDIRFAASIDRFDLVADFDQTLGCVRATARRSLAR